MPLHNNDFFITNKKNLDDFSDFPILAIVGYEKDLNKPTKAMIETIGEWIVGNTLRGYSIYLSDLVADFTKIPLISSHLHDSLCNLTNYFISLDVKIIINLLIMCDDEVLEYIYYDGRMLEIEEADTIKFVATINSSEKGDK